LLHRLGDALQQGHTCLTQTHRQWPEHPLIVQAANALISPAPLVADGPYLYLYRQWQQERQIAHQLALLIRQSLAAVQIVLDPMDTANSRQQDAIALAARQAFSLITGGPGTGKTFTLVRIVQALQAAQPDLRIALAAPTGKAAQRMEEVLTKAFDQAGISQDRIQTAQTVHRLLGLGNGQRPRYHREQPLPFDLIVIDEGSMLDLALASLLIDAIAVGTRLIILGDSDQLAAVDAGAVLADLAHADDLADYRIHLIESKRFGPDSGIGQLADVIRQGRSAALAGVLQGNDQVSLHQPTLQQPEHMYDALWAGYADYVEALRSQASPIDLLAVFDRYRVLCAQRHRRMGTVLVNKALGERLQRDLGERQGQGLALSDWYQGRPVLMTRNDYSLQLSNGDVGLCLADETGRWQVHFAHLNAPIAVSRLPPEQLDTAFALTIHKSQGSEFDEVALLLDPEAGTLLSRELVYTAVTRAKARVQIWSELALLQKTIARRAMRHSGLADQLHEALVG
jgi:exodeoxyribonuclease V alpha subunit